MFIYYFYYYYYSFYYYYIYLFIHTHKYPQNSNLDDISLFKPLLILMIYGKGKEGLPRNYVP